VHEAKKPPFKKVGRAESAPGGDYTLRRMPEATREAFPEEAA
jgi:hypothetical protein